MTIGAKILEIQTGWIWRQHFEISFHVFISLQFVRKAWNSSDWRRSSRNLTGWAYDAVRKAESDNSLSLYFKAKKLKWFTNLRKKPVWKSCLLYCWMSPWFSLGRANVKVESWCKVFFFYCLWLRMLIFKRSEVSV